MQYLKNVFLEKRRVNFSLKNRLINSFDYKTFEKFTPIAKGGYGEVKRAYAKTLSKDVALKSLYNVKKNCEFYQMFMREVNDFFF